MLSFLSDALTVVFGFPFAFAFGLPFGFAELRHFIADPPSSFRRQCQSGQVPDAFIDGSIRACRRVLQFLGVLIPDPDDADAVFVQCDRTVRPADQIQYDGVTFLRGRFDSQIMTFLFLRISGETGVIVNIGKRSADGVSADCYAALQVANDLAQQVNSWPDVSAQGQLAAFV